MRKLLSATTAIVLAGGIAWASNIPFINGPYDPGNAVGFFNALIYSINFGSSGLQSFTKNVTSLPTTQGLPFVTTLIPTGQFTAAGQGMRITCGQIILLSFTRRPALAGSIAGIAPYQAIAAARRGAVRPSVTSPQYERSARRASTSIAAGRHVT